METCTQIVVNLEQKIFEINSGSQSVFDEMEIVISACKLALSQLRIYILSNGFSSPADECHFFKRIKPIPIGYIICYLNLPDFYVARPHGSNRKLKAFYHKYLSLYQDYFLEHKSFYQYLERNRTDRDFEYFRRYQGKLKFHPDSLQYFMDEDFSTSHDYITAKIFAHKLLIERLTKELKALKDSSQPSEQSSISNLHWTGNKVDLIELIYGLHATGTINNGQTDIKELASMFQHVLNIDLGEYYRTYIEIRSRKINPTKFLDRMIQNLQIRMTQADD